MMEKNISIIALLSSLFLLNSCVSKVTTIDGIIEDIDAHVLLYSNPKLDICYNNFMDTIVLQDNGEFNLSFELNENQFVILKSPKLGKEYILPIINGEDYHVSIGNNNKLTVNGPNEEGILLYQTMPQYKPGNIDWSIYQSESSTYEELIEKYKQEELNKFQELLNEKKISKSFYKLIKNDRDCFYGIIAAWLHSWDIMAVIRNLEDDKDIASKDEYIDKLTNIFDKYKPQNKDLMKSPSWDQYGIFAYIIVYKQFLHDKRDKDNIERLLSDDNIPFWFEQIKESFSNNTLESALALFLYQKGGPESFSESKESIPVFKYFKENFPNSEYLKYFEHQMKRTISFYEEGKTDSSIIIVENRSNINTFEELLSKFKGQKIYVDVWATWCGPCRKEFKYHDSLKVILEQNNTTPLFISLDKDNEDEKWKALINVLELKGYHLRANESLINDLKEIYVTGSENKNKTFSIPWYILIDEDGNIVKRHFSRPSEITVNKILLE